MPFIIVINSGKARNSLASLAKRKCRTNLRGPVGIIDMSAFVVEFSNEIAVSLGISADRIIVYSVGSGSIVVHFYIAAGTGAERAATDAVSGLAAIRNVGRWTRCHGTRSHGDYGRACHDGDDAGGGASGPTTPVSPLAGDDGSGLPGGGTLISIIGPGLPGAFKRPQSFSL